MPDSAAFTGVLVNFVRELRGAGLPAGTGDAAAYCAAMASLDPTDLADLYWAGRTTLVSRRESIGPYDEVFRRYFLDAAGPAAELLTLKARLTTENEAVLTFVRHFEGERPVGTDASSSQTVLCVNNLASRPQATTIQLPERYAGAQLVDLFGGQGFPKVGDDGRVLITLGSRDFFWLQVRGDSDHG